MGIERANTPEFKLIVGDNWPELDETTYASRASEQFANSQKMVTGATSVTNMAGQVAESMQGMTANASEEKSAERVQNFTAKGAVTANRAGSTALAGQNILNTKTALNTIATGYETAWQGVKAQAVAEGWDQNQLQEAKDALVDEYKNQADSVGANFEQADTELKGQIKKVPNPRFRLPCRLALLLEKVGVSLATAPTGTDAANAGHARTGHGHGAAVASAASGRAGTAR